MGYIDGNVRVVNNYSYANVTGGSYVGGIVGRVASTPLRNTNYNDNSHCAVVCNMFYGNLSGSSNVSPVYAGFHQSNVQNTNEYNYWRSRADVAYNNYNNQLAIDKDAYLNRFPFYRHILNTHRELAAIYLFGERTDEDVAKIGHWYNVKNDEKLQFPVIEEWLSSTKRTTVDIAANLPTTTENYAGKLLTEMGNNGYLTVNVSINGSTYTSSLPITDMDTLNYDFTWGKVVLPFANEYSGWTRNYSQICTGWKITSVTGGTAGTLANYNFADRDCTAKDLYTNSNYIFAQGGNYIVPYGVTAISIEANFATAFYLSDAYYDYGYDGGYNGQTGLTTTVPDTYHGRTVYTNLGTLINALTNSANPHSQAIVLVGNFHYNQQVIGTLFDVNKAVTIMSVDEDNNQEPDYGWYSYHTTDRTDVPPMRFDFVPNIGIGMAARTTGSTPYPTIGIWHGHGWFELTETCVSFMSECEINSDSFNAADNGNGNNRWIANSGYFIQIVRARDGNCTKLSYIQIGGNAYVEELYPGCHTDNALTVNLVPINVTGGEIEECYMTGYRAGSNATGDNIRFWCAGGKIHKYLSAYMENPNSGNVNVTAKVDHARIGRFFGGGTSQSAKITGNIDVTINNSLVDFYCGGPEFGDMADGKTVTTHATGTTFGQYYGAGFGGTSITYRRDGNQSGVSFGNNLTYPIGWNSYHRLENAPNLGIGSSYKFEYILYSGGSGTGVARFYTGYAAFDLAQTGPVTNVLNKCTVLGDYYGAGCQGTVVGDVKSTLTDCDVRGRAFGGGYKAAANEVNVYPTTQPTYSVYTKETGLFSPFGTVEPETYTWEQRGTSGSNEGAKKLYTTTDMTKLGTVTGNIELTITSADGQSIVGESVYGGGNESPATGNCTVVVDGNTEVGPDGMQMTAAEGPDDSGHVFGAGRGVTADEAHSVIGSGASAVGIGSVGGNIDLTIGGTAFIKGSVYGGGENGFVGGNTHVTIEGDCQIGQSEGKMERYTAEEWEEEDPADFTECAHWPYEDGHRGESYDLYADTEGYDARGGAKVAKDGRTFYGNVFGGGSGYYPYAPGQWLATSGNVAGNATVDILGGHILTSVYGGNELTNVLGTATINMVAGTVGVPRTDAQMKAHPVTCYVFGAGKGDPRVFFNTFTNVAHAYVNISGTARIFGSTFGGGEDGHVLGNAVTNIGGTVNIGGTYVPATNSYTGGTNHPYSNVVIGTTGTSGVDGNVFGAGRGYSALALTIGLVKGNVETHITNGKIYGSVFGGGRTASVGTYQVSAGTPNYGLMMDCVKNEVADDPHTTSINESEHNHGHVFVSISGNAEIGRIDASLSNERGDTGDMLAESDALEEGEKQPSIGDVFGGGKGLALHDDQELSRKFGWVKNSTVKIFGSAKVFGSVYGGGEISCVGNPNEPKPAAGEDWNTGLSTVSIYGSATIGTQNNSYGEHGKGYVYGSGKGIAGSHYSEEAYVKNAVVTIGAETSASAASGSPRVWGSVFGGGEDGHVRKDTKVFIKGGIIGSPMVAHNPTDPTQDETYDEWWFNPNNGASKVIVYRGNVYAGGRGIDHDDDDAGVDFSTTAGAVYGNASVEMTGGHVYHNIYGSGAMASVGTIITKDAGGNPIMIGGKVVNYDNAAWDTSTGHVTVTVTGGMVGDDTEGHEGRNNGRVFGAGRGLAGNIEGEAAHLEYVYSTQVNIGGTAQVLGGVYGGGENGHVKTDTEVNIQGNCVIGSPLSLDECQVSENGAKGNAFRGNVFGGGRGVDAAGDVSEHRSFTAGRVFGNTTVNVSGGLIYRAVYGGGMLASVGNPTRSATRYHNPDDGENHSNDYFTIAEWPFNETTNRNGVATVNIRGGWIGNVSDEDQPLSGSGTTMGEPGRNNGAVFGSGAGFMATDGTSEQYSQLAYVYRSYVNISDEATGTGAKHTHIRAAVFGGGENGHVWENATVNINGGTIGNAADGTNGGDFTFAGNVFGSGRGMNVTRQNQTDIVSTTAGWVKGNTTVNVWAADAENPPVICRDVYGGGNLGSVGDKDEVKGTAGDEGRDKFGFKTGLATVNILGGDIYGNVYGSSRGGASVLHEYQDMSYVKNTMVTITGTATIHAKNHTDNDHGGYVYGGGNSGHVRRNTEVVVGGEKSITAQTGMTTSTAVSVTASGTLKPGGTIERTLFGAGRGNEVSATAGQVNHSVQVDIKEGSLIKGDVYGGGAIGNSNMHDERNTDAPASCKEVCTTKVNLLGGVVLGDAYGGGQGIRYDASKYTAYTAEQKTDIEKNCAAIVHGNVELTLDGTAFKLNTTTDNSTPAKTVPTSGRLFGCNNINGSPKGTVLVNVKQTRGLTETTTSGVTTYTAKAVNDKPTKVNELTDDTPGTYELQAVYGGGNLAAYVPTDASATGQYTENGHSATNQPLQVVIDGCGLTSIEYVYGGGNAAPTPSTDVLILGTYEVGQAFGGGNGKDKYTLDGGTTWNANEGADVGIQATSHDDNGKATGTTYGTGNTTVTMQGGTVHHLFGGSNTKGDIVGTTKVVLGDENLQSCEFCVDEAYGGGNEAYMSGGSDTDMKCIDGMKALYGGSRMADVNGDINLTITGGYYAKVFGGNNLGGKIHGRITVNVEEKGCLPIYIGELYGGGNQADYSVEDISFHDDEKTYQHFPKVNIVSASHIGTIYGGGYKAKVTGSPHININMTTGMANGEYLWHNTRSLKGLGLTGSEPFYAEMVERYKAASKVVPDSDPAVNRTDSDPTYFTNTALFPLGFIGTIFGGGNQAEVEGDTYVHIGTGVAEDGTELPRKNAQIRNNVFGGGNNAAVKGNTHVVVGS